MNTQAHPIQFALHIEYFALLKTFLVADILAEDFGQPFVEFGFVGFADKSFPFHVLDVLLLPYQSVSSGHVYDSGDHLFILYEEIESLSKMHAKRFIPIVFIHRHPAGTQYSSTDKTFLTEVFLDQVTANLTFKENPNVLTAQFTCACPILEDRNTRSVLAFSLIINRQREHSLYYALRHNCLYCNTEKTDFGEAKLVIKNKMAVNESRMNSIRKELFENIQKKLIFNDGY